MVIQKVAWQDIGGKRQRTLGAMNLGHFALAVWISLLQGGC